MMNWLRKWIKKRISEDNPEITDLVRKLRRKTDSKGKPMSFRKIEKVLKEEYDHSVSYKSVQRILEDVEIFKKEERNRKRRKWRSDFFLKESISFFFMGSTIWLQFSSAFLDWSIWFTRIKDQPSQNSLQELSLNQSRFRNQ